MATHTPNMGRSGLDLLTLSFLRFDLNSYCSREPGMPSDADKFRELLPFRDRCQELGAPLSVLH
jgi:hypothetical protein